MTRSFEALWDPSDDLDAILGTHKYDATPLLQAVVSGSIEMVKLLLGLRIVDPNVRNRAGLSPLRAAIVERNADAVELLLQHGAGDPDDGPAV